MNGRAEDDMVIRPKPHDDAKIVRVRTKLDAAASKVDRFARQRSAWLLRSAAQRAGVQGLARMAVAEQGVLSKMVKSPATAAAAALVTIGAFSAHEGTGMTFETMGNIMSHDALGDMPADAVAARMARLRLMGNPIVQNLAARKGVTTQMLKAHDMYANIYGRELRGSQAIMRSKGMQVPGFAEQAYATFKASLARAVEATGFWDTFAEIAVWLSKKVGK